MKARKYRLSCPFCGSECEKYNNLAAKAFGGKTIVMYKCINQACGATVSFDNMVCNLDPNVTDSYFMTRYLGGDNHD